MSRPIGTRTAFIALFQTTEMFHQVAEAAGGWLDAFFVSSMPVTRDRLIRLGVPAERILDLSATRRAVRGMGPAPEALRQRIGRWEAAAGLMFPSMILMSRFHRDEDAVPLLHYMGVCAARMQEFFAANGIEWVIAEPTNVVELLAYAVSRKLGIPFGHIAHARLPSDRLLLFSDVFESRFHPLSPTEETGPGDYAGMAAWLEQFRNRPDRPAYFAGQSRGRSLSNLARSAIANLGSAARECAGETQINDYRFLQRCRLHVRPYLGALKRRALRKILPPPSFVPGRPYIAYFLHVYPERSVDVVSPWYNDQAAVIAALRRAAPSTCDVLVKEHPSAAGWQTPAFYRALGRIPGIYLLGAEFDSRRLIRDAALTVTLSGTAAYEAALLDAPSLIFSDVFFGRLPRVRQCRALPDLPGTVADVLAGGRAENGGDEAVLDYLLDVRRNSERAVWDGNAAHVGADLAGALAQLLRRAMDYRKRAGARVGEAAVALGGE